MHPSSQRSAGENLDLDSSEIKPIDWQLIAIFKHDTHIKTPFLSFVLYTYIPVPATHSNSTHLCTFRYAPSPQSAVCWPARVVRLQTASCSVITEAAAVALQGLQSTDDVNTTMPLRLLQAFTLEQLSSLNLA